MSGGVVNCVYGLGWLVGVWCGVGVDTCDDGCVVGSSDEVVFDLLLHVVVAVVFRVGFMDV